MKQTTKSLVTTLGVLALAAAIGGAALWVTRDTEKKAEQKEKSAKLFDELDKAKVRQVKLVSGGKLVALVTRADASAPWKIVEPVAAEADASTVDAVVNGVADFKQKSELSEADPTQYGLDRPNLVVSVKTEDGKESSVEIGESNPFDSSIYVRKAGEKTVRIADGWTKAPFEKQLLDLRDKRVLHLDDTAEVRRVEVAGTAPAYALEKDGASWKMLAPQKDAADTATADRVATALKSLRATGIAAESAGGAALKQYGLSPAKITVQLTVAAAGGKDTYRRTLLLGQPAPQKGSVAVKTYAKRDDAPTVFEVDQQVLKDLQKDLFDLQDKALAHANREDVRKIVLEQPGSPKIVERAVLDHGAARGGVRLEARPQGVRSGAHHHPARRRRQGPRQGPHRRPDQGRQAPLRLFGRPAPHRRNRQGHRGRPPQVPRRPPRTPSLSGRRDQSASRKVTKDERGGAETRRSCF